LTNEEFSELSEVTELVGSRWLRPAVRCYNPPVSSNNVHECLRRFTDNYAHERWP